MSIRSDEGREAAGVIEGFGCVNGGVPCVAEEVGVRRDRKGGRKGVVRHGLDDFKRGIHALTAVHHVVPAPSGRVGEESRIARSEGREEAHVVGMVGHDEKIERAGELDGLARGGDDPFAASKAEGVRR